MDLKSIEWMKEEGVGIVVDVSDRVYFQEPEEYLQQVYALGETMSLIVVDDLSLVRNDQQMQLG